MSMCSMLIRTISGELSATTSINALVKTNREGYLDQLRAPPMLVSLRKHCGVSERHQSQSDRAPESETIHNDSTFRDERALKRRLPSRHCRDQAFPAAAFPLRPAASSILRSTAFVPL